MSFLGFSSKNKIDISSTKSAGITALNYVKWTGNTVSNLWTSRSEIGKIIDNAATNSK